MDTQRVIQELQKLIRKSPDEKDIYFNDGIITSIEKVKELEKTTSDSVSTT